MPNRELDLKPLLMLWTTFQTIPPRTIPTTAIIIIIHQTVEFNRCRTLMELLRQHHQLIINHRRLMYNMKEWVLTVTITCITTTAVTSRRPVILHRQAHQTTVTIKSKRTKWSKSQHLKWAQWVKTINRRHQKSITNKTYQHLHPTTTTHRKIIVMATIRAATRPAPKTIIIMAIMNDCMKINISSSSNRRIITLKRNLIMVVACHRRHRLQRLPLWETECMWCAAIAAYWIRDTS